jgi:hypothetical protein
MPDYDNSNQCALWRNKRLDEPDVRPNTPPFTGSGEVGGVEYWISAWKKPEDAKDGHPLLKLAFTPKDENYVKPETATATEAGEPFDSDIDF